MKNGFQIFRRVLSSHDIDSMRDAIAETIDRVARAMRIDFTASCPNETLEDRLDAVVRHERTFALALFRAAMADAHRDARIEALAQHPGLTPIIADLLRPMVRTAHVIRPRAVVSAFSTSRHRWRQDVVRPAGDGMTCGSVRLACWIPLADVNQLTGALELIPGEWQSIPHLSDGEGRFFIPDDGLPAVERHIASLKRGDVLILDRFIPHRSLPAQNHKARWAVAMWVKAAERGCQ